MTSATERLRALLDERGVEWKAAKAPLPVTSWHGAHGFKFTAMNPYGVTDYLLVQTNTLDEWPHLTPEQAVDATLGPCTCRDVRSEDATIAFECSECGCWVAYDEYWETGIYIQGEGQQAHIHPRYCPNCGRKVVE